MITLKEIESRLVALLEDSKGVIPENQIQEMLSLAKAGEPGIALENYCSQLVEYDAVISNSFKDEIETLGTAMGIRTDYWEPLRVREKSGDERKF